MAFQTRDVLEAMQRDAGLPLTTLKVDGGAAANNLLMQFQADLLDVAVRRPVVAETTALGRGLSRRASPSATGRTSTTSPATGPSTASSRPPCRRRQRDGLVRRWQKAVARSRDWEEHAG